MDKDHLAQRLMVTFLGELEDHVRSLERDLLALEKQSMPLARQELFATLFRSAHSLKGAARSVGVTSLESAGHRLEELFVAGRDGRMPLDASYFNSVLLIVDELREAGQSLQVTAGNGNPRVVTQPGGQAPPMVPAISMAPTADANAAEPPASAPWSGMVRVSAARLDALLAQSGELLVMRHRARERVQVARALLETAGNWAKEWRRIEHQWADLVGNAATVAGSPSSDEFAESPRRQLRRLSSRYKAGLSRFARDLQRLVAELNGDQRLLEQTAERIDAEVHHVRLLPFGEVCEGFDRMVRDLAAAGGKRAEVAIEGGGIAVDRSVLEGLKDPLIHLIRNAVDHGIEAVSARRAAGKPETGRIAVSAAVRQARFEITVSDDGQGLDLAAIRERLRKQGLVSPENDEELVEQIFLTGFSTSPTVTAVSGRGVGLEIVKTRVKDMRGTVAITFEPGRGTRFILRVPLTLTSLRALIVEAGGRTFTIDTAGVERVLRVGAGDIHSIEGREATMLGRRPVRIATLAQLLGIPDRAAGVAEEKRPAVVLTDGDRVAAIVVDDIQAEREIRVRSFGPRLRRARHVTGPTLLPDGKVALVLNTADLMDSMRKLIGSSTVAQSMTMTNAAENRRLLLVDDSITTRTLEKTILEAAGYDVLIATDGVEAWQLLLERGADLVVSDVEMPRMDGFALTETIRNSRQFRELPVILMTARDNDTDKAHGLKVGANAYLCKSAFDQRELLATIGQIL